VLTILKAAFPMLLFGTLISEAQTSTSTQTPIVSTVCQLVKRPDTFDGKRVMFHAAAQSDSIEHTSLTDGHCRFGIAPIDGRDDDPGVQAFERAIFTKPYGTAFKKITGTFSGRFEFHPGSIPRFVVRLEHVSDLKVSRSGHL